MTPEQFAKAGRALFGPLYKTPLARALGNEPRTVRRWADGSFPIADGVRDDLIRLLTAREIEIDKVLGDFAAEAGPAGPGGPASNKGERA